MAFQSAQKARALVGTLNLSGYAKSVSVTWNQDALDVTTLADTAKAFIVGQDTATAAISLLYDTDTTAGGEYDFIQGTWKTTQPQPLTYAPAGLTTGSPALLMSAIETTAGGSVSASDVAMMDVAAQIDGATDMGTVVEDLTAVTIDGNGTARDGTAASANGGVAHLHVTAFSGLTSDVITIEHSVDGSTSWATLVTFATVSAITSERVVVAAGTTVRRYLRVVDNVTGTGSCTRSVSFARR